MPSLIWMTAWTAMLKALAVVSYRMCTHHILFNPIMTCHSWVMCIWPHYQCIAATSWSHFSELTSQTIEFSIHKLNKCLSKLRMCSALCSLSRLMAALEDIFWACLLGFLFPRTRMWRHSYGALNLSEAFRALQSCNRIAKTANQRKYASRPLQPA
jgi:hypothetical protein